MSVCVAFGMFLFARPTNSASAITTDYEASNDGFDILGLSIKYIGASGKDGMRVGVKISRTLYNELAADNNAVAGVLIAPKDQCVAANGVSKGNLNVWNASASHAQYGILYRGSSAGSYVNQWHVADTYAQGVVYLDGFPSASYNRPLNIRGYIDWNNDSNASTTAHCEMVTKSMSDVALAVQTDYAGSNTYGTTSDQNTKLNTYLLSYNVTFLDPYGNTASTQSIRYGSKFTAPSAPASRTGYTHSGWCAKNGASSYATTTTDLSVADNRVVKYATSYKPKFTTTGSTFQKPVLEKKFTGYDDYKGASDAAYVDNDGTQIVVTDDKENVFFYQDVGIAQNTAFVVYATVTGSSSLQHAGDIGFVVGTLASDSNHLLFHFRSDDLYLARLMGTKTNTSAGWWTGGYDTRTKNETIALVYPGDGYYYMYINGVCQGKISETLSIVNAWSGGTFTMQSYIGTSGTKKIGLAAYGGNLYCSDWGYSTDASTIASYTKTVKRPPVYYKYNTQPTTMTTSGTTATITTNGNSIASTFFTGLEVSQTQSFAVYANVNSEFSGKNIGFVVGTLAADANHLLFHWRSGDMYLWRNISWTGHEDNKWTPGYGNNSAAKSIALVYKSGYFYLFLGGVQKAKIDETADTGWGMVPKNAIGTSGTRKIGLSVSNGSMVCSDWGYSTDESWITSNYSLS